MAASPLSSVVVHGLRRLGHRPEPGAFTARHWHTSAAWAAAVSFFEVDGNAVSLLRVDYQLCARVKLHFVEALIAQPFGLVVFLLTVSVIPLSAYLIYNRVPCRRIIESPRVNRAMYALIALCMIGWAYKVSVMM